MPCCAVLCCAVPCCAVLCRRECAVDNTILACMHPVQQPGLGLLCNLVILLLCLVQAMESKLNPQNQHSRADPAHNGLLQVPGVYTQQNSDAALSYPSTSYLDDMAYAAAWMYYATKVFRQSVHQHEESLCSCFSIYC